MRLLAVLCFAAMLSAAAVAKEGCSATWRKEGFKSYHQVEEEVRAKLGAIKILKIALCGTGAQRYFHVTVLNAAGTVSTVEVAAH